jgi:FAD synthetase
MVFGTFDGLHKGHENFFRQARKLAKDAVLVVSVARDKNVKRIKGRLPQIKERQRVLNLKKLTLVNEVVMGNQLGYIQHIVRAKPQIIALGYDQTHYIEGLAEQLKARGITVKIVRLKPYKPHLYKSSLLKAKSSNRKSL